MALVNWCKKCAAEVPPGESCPYCGAKLAKTGERLSFGGERLPVRDWFSWNAALRVVVPVLGTVLLLTVVVEALTEGARGVQTVFVEGLFGVLLAAFALILLALLLLLCLQGRECVHYVLDAHGATSDVYLREPSPLRLYARMIPPQSVAALDDSGRHVDGLTFIHGTRLLWTDVKRVRFWKEARVILLYRPRYWQVMAIACAPGEYETAEAYVRKRLARNKKVLPKA